MENVSVSTAAAVAEFPLFAHTVYELVASSHCFETPSTFYPSKNRRKKTSSFWLSNFARLLVSFSENGETSRSAGSFMYDRCILVCSLMENILALVKCIQYQEFVLVLNVTSEVLTVKEIVTHQEFHELLM